MSGGEGKREKDRESPQQQLSSIKLSYLLSFRDGRKGEKGGKRGKGELGASFMSLK